MACLSPISILNPAKRLSLEGGHQFVLSVPCGRCSACQDSKHFEYYYRAWIQAKETLDKFGFVLATVLTYNNKCLPHISDFIDDIVPGSSLDFPCFSRRDIRIFMLRLRSVLKAKGYDAAGGLNYFLASEYGTTEGKTHRPHYHVLFYVTFDIDPFDFSRIVGHCWSFGISDTLPFKSSFYVSRYIFGRGFNTASSSVQKQVQYITKYVQKSSIFENIIRSRLRAVIGRRENLSGSALDDYFESRDGRFIYSELFRRVNQFHRQGNGFGASFLRYNSIDSILESGMIILSDSEKVVRHIPLPMYYKRRLFYNLIKDFRGVRTWCLNDLGKEYKLKRLLQSVDLFERSVRDWLYNISSYCPPVSDGFSSDDFVKYRDNLLNSFFSTLGKRSLHDFAVYVMLFKGRLKSSEQTTREFFGVVRSDGLDSWLPSCCQSSLDFSVFTFSYITNKDFSDYGSRFVSPHYFPPSEVTHHYKLKLRDFIKYYVINDSSDASWRGFDYLYTLYCESLQYHALPVNNARKLKENLQFIYKISNHAL